MQENKEILFVNTNHNDLFKIKDGAKIKITLSGDCSTEKTCKYKDKYHFYLGSVLYHIYDFAENMEKIEAKYEPIRRNQGE